MSGKKKWGHLTAQQLVHCKAQTLVCCSEQKSEKLWARCLVLQLVARMVLPLGQRLELTWAQSMETRLAFQLVRTYRTSAPLLTTNQRSRLQQHCTFASLRH